MEKIVVNYKSKLLHLKQVYEVKKDETKGKNLIL